MIAVLGPDGAGKGTLIDALVARLPVARSTRYLGLSKVSSAATTPTEGGRATQSPRGPLARFVRPREMAFLTRKWLRAVPIFLSAYRAAWKGHVVILDRHPLDAVAVRPRRAVLGAWWERVLSTTLSPSPDLVLVLDAPGTELFARKGEHTPEVLEAWRQGYRALPGRVLVLDATCPPHEVADRASEALWEALARRRAWSVGRGPETSRAVT